MSKLNNIAMFASNDGGHFAQLMALKNLFGKYDSVVLTDNKRANRNIPALKDVKAIEFAMAFADKRDELTKDKKSKIDSCELSVRLLDFISSVSRNLEKISSQSNCIYRQQYSCPFYVLLRNCTVLVLFT